jgi:SPP1 family predicted phage head-tail adaptor
MQMISGRMRHYIEIENYTEVIQANGEVLRTWVVFANVWAEVLEESSREVQQAKAQNNKITHLVKSRWIDGLTAKMRAVLINENNRILNFAGSPIADRTHRKMIKVFCIEESN